MFALEWLIEELVEDGDQIVCLRVVDKDSKVAGEPSVQQGIYKEEARELLETVQKKNHGGKAISLVLELAVGKVQDTIQRMVSQCKLVDYDSLSQTLSPYSSKAPSLQSFFLSHPLLILPPSLDPTPRTNQSHRRNTRPRPQRYLQPAPQRQRQQVLPAELARARRRRATQRPARKEQSKAHGQQLQEARL